jgi:peroxiredoxin
LKIAKTGLWLLGLVIPAVAAADAESSIGRAIEAISLPDYHGQLRSLDEFGEARAIVVAFLGTECPLARHYGRRLGELAAEFEERGVVFLGVDSNVQDSLTEIAAYANRYEIPFPILVDPRQQVADLLGAERTPEVFVLDQNRIVRYRGRVDDQYGIGVQKEAPQRRDLADALEQMLDGQPVTVTRTPTVGCLIGREREIEPHGKITYSSHIADILNRRCVECHRDGQIAPFSLATYDDVEGWEAMIAEVVQEGRMPPWSANPAHGTFRNDARLTDQEKQQLLTWIENGCPLGDPAAVPEPPQFADGWRIPQPDQVIYMADEPFDVPATGVVDYQHFLVDPQWDEDRYIVAAEARPGNTEVVHHIIAYVRVPGEERRRSLGSMLIGYAPGSPPLEYPEGTAIFVPRGAQLLFELHYTPNGYAQSDRSYIGLTFTDKKNVKQVVRGAHVAEGEFEIPPHVSDHLVEADRPLEREIDLLTLTPHMHVRGKAFRFTAHYPDGREEILLDVPRYDFNWQLRYELAQPKRLPAETVLHCQARYDNSSENLNNPDPEATVTWGEQSWEEMMIGFYTFTTPHDPLAQAEEEDANEQNDEDQ